MRFCYCHRCFFWTQADSILFFLVLSPEPDAVFSVGANKGDVQDVADGPLAHRRSGHFPDQQEYGVRPLRWKSLLQLISSSFSPTQTLLAQSFSPPLNLLVPFLPIFLLLPPPLNPSFPIPPFRPSLHISSTRLSLPRTRLKWSWWFYNSIQTKPNKKTFSPKMVFDNIVMISSNAYLTKSKPGCPTR